MIICKMISGNKSQAKEIVYILFIFYILIDNGKIKT